MIPIDAREIIKNDAKYTNPFLTGQRSKIPPPILVDVTESEDSFYMDPSPLNRSDGEIGGDLYMQSLKDRRKPEPGLAKPVNTRNNSKLAQTHGYLENVPNDGVKDPIYESGEGPVTHPTRAGKVGA